MISISFKVRTAQMVASDGIMSRGTMGAFWSLSFSGCLFFEFFPSKAFGDFIVNPVQVQAGKQLSK